MGKGKADSRAVWFKLQSSGERESAYFDILSRQSLLPKISIFHAVEVDLIVINMTSLLSVEKSFC